MARGEDCVQPACLKVLGLKSQNLVPVIDPASAVMGAVAATVAIVAICRKLANHRGKRNITAPREAVSNPYRIPFR